MKCMRTEMFYTVRVICTCDQRDSAVCALQLTALIKFHWCVLLYCCACLHPNTILMEEGWITVPCPATNFSILICKSSARTKRDYCCSQKNSRNEIGNLYTQNVTSASTRWLYWFHTKVPPTFYNKIAPMNTGKKIQMWFLKKRRTCVLLKILIVVISVGLPVAVNNPVPASQVGFQQFRAIQHFCVEGSNKRSDRGHSSNDLEFFPNRAFRGSFSDFGK